MRNFGFWMTLAMLSGQAFAQVVDVPAEIKTQRALLDAQRAQVIQSHEKMERDCWQKFAVNDCLAQMRKSRRAQLDPLHQKELELNVIEREWRTRQREERLKGKQPEAGGQSGQ